MEQKKRTPINEIGVSPADSIASPGKFRAVVLIDSCPYQIGEDTPDLGIAVERTYEYNTSCEQPVQIFDDKGKAYIIDGQVVQ